MLHTLLDQARRMNLDAEAGFTSKTVRWLIQFAKDGKFLGIIDQSDPGVKRSRGRTFAKVPHLKFSGDTPMRQFLVDSAHYALLFGQNEPDEKHLRKHAFFLNLLREAASADLAFGVIADALSNDATRKAICDELGSPDRKAKAADSVTFAVMDGETPRILVEESTWHDWWRGYFPTLFTDKGCKQNDTLCLLTGALGETARTHPKIKGLGGVGGKVETTLVGFNEPAFESFGLTQSYNAAVGKQAAEDYAAALNHLIQHNSVTLAGAKIVYWYDSEIAPQNDPVQELLGNLDFGDAEVTDESEASATGEERHVRQAEDRARDQLESLRTGKRSDLGDCHYYALTLSGNSARVVVRDWMEGQFNELCENVNAWFEDFSIVRRDGVDVVRSHKFAAILAGTVRDLKDVAAPLVSSLWHAAICNEPIPHGAMAQTLARVRIDVITAKPEYHARLGLLKAFCIRKGIDMTPELNEYLKHPAYLCGRIMAILAQIQLKALGDVGAGVVQRYYASASVTPALVLGRLVRLAQVGHLPKIEGGLGHWYDRQLGEVWDIFEETPPATLSLEDQTLFALGYYQQKAKRYDNNKDTNASESNEITE